MFATVSICFYRKAHGCISQYLSYPSQITSSKTILNEYDAYDPLANTHHLKMEFYLINNRQMQQQLHFCMKTKGEEQRMAIRLEHIRSASNGTDSCRHYFLE